MTSKVLPLLALVCIPFRKSIQSQLPDTLETLVTNVVQVGSDEIRDPEESRMEIWFFKSSNSGSYSEALLERLIATEPLAGHTKVLFDEFSATNSCFGRPALVIAFFGGNESLAVGSRLFAQFVRINDQTKLIVLFPFESIDYFQLILKFFKSVSLFNVVYIAIFVESYDYTAFNYMVISDRIQTIDQFRRQLRYMFPEQMVFQGQTISACTGHTGFYSELDPLSGIPKGFDVQLVKLVINRMNAELQVHYETCDPNVKEVSCIERHIIRNSCKFHFGRWVLEDVENGVPISPMQEMVVVVPRGTPLNVFELLRAPYATLAWKVVISTAILGLMVAQIIWKHSAVNLLLLILCELGESIHDRKKPAERLLIFGFIMLVYLLMSAYEAKLVSFLADWPYNPDINSIDELQHTKILLLSNYLTESTLNDSRLRGLIKRTNISLAKELFTIPPNTGFVSQYEIAHIILQKQLNIDRRTGRARFVMLEERLDSNLAFFFFGKRNPLRSRFAQLQHRVYESGLSQHWIRTFAAQQSFRQVVDEPPKMIQFEQLQQLAMVFVPLWICCTIVFLLELTLYWLKKRWHKIRKGKK